MANKINVGLGLRSAREALNLTRREVVQELEQRGIDVTEFTLFNWEKGVTSPPADRLPVLAEILKVKMQYFFDLKHNQKVRS